MAQFVKMYELDDPDLPVEFYMLRRVFNVRPPKLSSYYKAQKEAEKLRKKAREQEAAKQQTNLLEQS